MGAIRSFILRKWVASFLDLFGSSFWLLAVCSWSLCTTSASNQKVEPGKARGMRLSIRLCVGMQTKTNKNKQTNKQTNSLYHTAENFRGRKPWIGEKYDFRRENFRRLLAFATPKNATSQISQRKLSRIATKLQNLRKFFPSTVSCYKVVQLMKNPTPYNLMMTVDQSANSSSSSS